MKADVLVAYRLVLAILAWHEKEAKTAGGPGRVVRVVGAVAAQRGK